MLSYSQLSEFDLLLDLDLDLANNRLWPVNNIQVYFGKFSLIDVSKILTLGKLVKVIFGEAFHKLKYKPSLKSL